MLCSSIHLPRVSSNAFPQGYSFLKALLIVCESQSKSDTFSIMRGLFAKLVIAASTCLTCNASADTTKKPQIQMLPRLREQAQIVDAWTEERKALIPGILRKYGVDAWLVRSISYLMQNRPILLHDICR